MPDFPRSVDVIDRLARALGVVDSLTKWGGTALTGRDISGDLSKLDVALSTKARLQPWDRGWTRQSISYMASAIAPHAESTRGTYTIPVGKLAQLGMASATLIRDATTATPGLAVLYLDTSGWTAETLHGASYSATVGDQDGHDVGRGAVAEADLIWRFRSFDLSTGGTYTYRCGASFEEFDV